jgi:hypothetical protein
MFLLVEIVRSFSVIIELTHHVDCIHAFPCLLHHSIELITHHYTFSLFGTFDWLSKADEKKTPFP